MECNFCYCIVVFAEKSVSAVVCHRKCKKKIRVAHELVIYEGMSERHRNNTE